MDGARTATRPMLTAATLAMLFTGALLANLGYAGTSPVASLDTFNDEKEVQQCLTGDSCTLEGVATSLPGLVHAVGWLDLRALISWLGLGLDGAHVLMQVLNALALVLVFHLATRLGGLLAGSLAVCILQFGIGPLNICRTELYNSSPQLFLGAVFLLSCTAAAERPGPAAVVIVALVAAVMANVHLACIVAGASVAWVALLEPRRRLRLAAIGMLVFAVATFVVAPPSWLYDLASVLQRRGSIRHTTGAMTMPYNSMLNWGPFAIGAWLLSFAGSASPWREYRRRVRGALAVMVPFLAVFFAASRLGIVADAKYLSYLKAACAVAAAIPIAIVLGHALGRLLAPGSLLRLERALPFALAFLIALRANVGFPDDDAWAPTFRELVPVFGVLHDEQGWDFPAILAGLKAPFSSSLLTGLEELSAAADPPRAVVGDPASSVLLLVMQPDEVPQPLPSNWRVLDRSLRAATVLVRTRSRIDWGAFEVRMRSADGPDQGWVASALQLDDLHNGLTLSNLPPPGLQSRGTLAMRLPLRPGPGVSNEIFMPRMRDICAGRITSPSEGSLTVTSDGRHATLAAEPREAGPPAIVIEWQIGSPGCGGGSYDGLPPFFVEGEAADVRLLESILRGRESRS